MRACFFFAKVGWESFWATVQIVQFSHCLVYFMVCLLFFSFGSFHSAVFLPLLCIHIKYSAIRYFFFFFGVEAIISERLESDG